MTPPVLPVIPVVPPTDAGAAAMARSTVTAPVAPTRRHLPKNRILRVIRWPVSWLLDRNGDLSASKIMAFAIYGAFLASKPIPAGVVGLLLATAFGYSMFKDFISRGTWTAASTDAVKLDVEQKLEHTITEQRYTTDGSGARVPAVSLPPVAGAKTPSGDD